MDTSDNQGEIDPYAEDPFFKFIPDQDWNACVGSQGHRENYIEGYIEAATELVGAVIDKKMFGKRDTLVLPILYNARHALELALKFAVDRLVDAGILKSGGRPSHNIKTYLGVLQTARIGDEKLQEALESVKPFVDSLSRIDKDGQALRYHINLSGEASLSEYSLVNLALVRKNLSRLSECIAILQNRTEAYVASVRPEHSPRAALGAICLPSRSSCRDGILGILNCLIKRKPN